MTEYEYNSLLKYRGGLYTGGRVTDEIRHFRKLGYIDAASYSSEYDRGEIYLNPTAWKLTLAGESAISEFEQKREQQAQDERERRFNRKIAIAQVLIPLITFILGLLAEHYVGILAWLCSLP